MAKVLPRPQIRVGEFVHPGLPHHTLVAMSAQDHLAAEALHWREKWAQHDAAMSAKQGEIDKLEATVRNQDVDLRRLRQRIAELESR